MAYRQYNPTDLHGPFPRGVRWLLIANTAVFLVCYLMGPAFQNQASVIVGLRAESAVRTFMVWQVFTYMFVHFGTWHLLFNMLALWMFGVPIEQTWGTRRFLKFYLLCGTVAGACVLVANMLVGDWFTPTIGASGAVFGVLMCRSGKAGCCGSSCRTFAATTGSGGCSAPRRSSRSTCRRRGAGLG